MPDDLTAAGEAGRLGTVIGRQTEIGRLIQILGRRTKTNPLLIGEPGVGKTTIVKGLVQRMLEGQVPAPLLDRRLLMLDGGSLVVGSMYRKLLEEIISSGAILFVDEVHILIGSARSSMDGANFLKAALCWRRTTTYRCHDAGGVSQILRERDSAGVAFPDNPGQRALD